MSLFVGLIIMLIKVLSYFLLGLCSTMDTSENSLSLFASGLDGFVNYWQSINAFYLAKILPNKRKEKKDV